MSDVAVGIEILKDSGIFELQDLAGPENSVDAKQQAPGAIRALFGKDKTRNAI